MKRGLSAWLLCVGCTLAMIAGWFAPIARARTEAPPPAVHGLAPLPGNAPVPLHDRPPGALPDDGGPSPIIFPPQQLTIRFNHRLHVKELGQACDSCHDKARTSHKSSDSLLPAVTRCDKCHQSDHSDLGSVKSSPELLSQCGYCHIGYRPEDGNRVARMNVPAPRLHFSHAIHAARNVGCGQCHGAVQNLELATRDQLPRMKGCFACHQMPEPARGDAAGECTTCHLAQPSGRLLTSYPEGHLEPPSWLYDSGHDPDFIRRHKFVAGNHSELCSSCHSEKFCTDCHDGRLRPRSIHPNDFLSLHAIAARQNAPDCGSCHRAQSFCLACHQRLGVTLSGPYANFAGRGRFHPPKAVWTDGPRTAQHHAVEAQRNLSACVSCHTEHDCTLCHATAEVGGPGRSANGGRGLSPHPPGFSSKCRRALRQNARPCLVCHHPQDAKLAQCR